MNELIAVRQSNVSGNEIPTVDARELHAFLEIGKGFSSWIKDRIKQYGFEDGKDYCLSLPENGEAQPCGFAANKTEYHLTLDMAKELSMVERNEKGKQARKYFIECEARLKNLQPQYALPKTHAETLRMLADTVELNERQAKALVEAQPKVEAFDHFIDGVNCKAVARVGKELGIGEITFFKFMRDIGYLQSSVTDWNLPYQRYLTAGYFAVKSIPVKIKDKFINKSQTLISPKGEVHLAILWREALHEK